MKNKRYGIIIIIFFLLVAVIFSMKGCTNKRAFFNNISKKEVIKNISKKEVIKENKKDKENINLKKDSNNKLEKRYEEGYKAFHSGKYEEAVKIEDEVIKQDKNFYKAYSIKGIALCYLGDLDSGMKSIDKCLEINPDYGYGRFNKALAYELYRHYDEALNWYDKALKVEDYVWSYYGKASIYGRRGDVENTIKYLNKAINMDSSIKEEARKEADFDNVRGNKEFQDLIK